MKRHYFILLFTSISLMIQAQVTSSSGELIATSEVPELVRDTQEENFPTAYVKDWTIERGLTVSDDDPVWYMATFSEGGSNFYSTATYLPNGMLMYSAKFMPTNVIPSPIVIRTRQEYDRFEIEGAYLITIPDPEREIFRVRLRDQGRLQMAYYTIDGFPIPKTELPEALLVFQY